MNSSHQSVVTSGFKSNKIVSENCLPQPARASKHYQQQNAVCLGWFFLSKIEKLFGPKNMWIFSAATGKRSAVAGGDRLLPRQLASNALLMVLMLFLTVWIVDRKVIARLAAVKLSALSALLGILYSIVLTTATQVVRSTNKRIHSAGSACHYGPRRLDPYSFNCINRRIKMHCILWG